MTLIAYDVSTTSAGGRRRLRRVARACSDFGQRVQFSVFECLVGPEQWLRLRTSPLEIIDPREDCLRIYPLDENARGRIEHVGRKEPLDFEGPLIIWPAMSRGPRDRSPTFLDNPGQLVNMRTIYLGPADPTCRRSPGGSAIF